MHSILPKKTYADLRSLVVDINLRTSALYDRGKEAAESVTASSAREREQEERKEDCREEASRREGINESKLVSKKARNGRNAGKER